MSAAGMALSRRNKKGDKCNLRKSLAWNQAFFTDEGVLNPVELSLLSGSAGESSGSALDGTIGELLPLSTISNCSSRPVLHELAENMVDKAARIQAKDTGAGGVVSKPGALNHELPPAHAAPGKIPLAKGTPRSMPPSPATSSQKRAASTSTAIPVSKIPKHMPTKSHVSSHSMTPRSSMLTAKSTKPFHKENTVGLDQSIGARSASTIDKKDLIYSSSSTKPFDNAHEKNTVTPVEKSTLSLMAVKDPPHPTKPHVPIISSGLSKTVSTIPRCAIHITRNPTTAVLAKPSALRMPSPSLGFFCQGKVSPSYSSQPQKHIQSSEFNLSSSEKPTYQKSLHELRPLSMHAVQQTIKGTAATSSDTGAVISESVKTLCVKENIEIGQLNARDKEGCIISESHGFQTDGKKQLKVGSLSVGGNIEERSSELNTNKERDEDTSFSQTDNMSLGEISKFIKKIPQSNVSEDILAADPSIGDFKRSEISPSDFPFAGERVLEKIEEGKSAEDSLFSHVGNAGHGTHIVLNKGKLAAKTSCYDHDLRPDIVAKNTDLTVSTESESFFRSSKEQIIGYGSCACKSSHRSDLEQLPEDSSEGEKQTTELHASNAGDGTPAVQSIDKLVAQVSYCIPSLGSASTAQADDSVASSDVESFFTSSKEQITDLVSCDNLSSQQQNGSGSPQESNLGANLNKHLRVGQTEGDGTYAVLGENKLEAQASYSIPDLGSGLTAANTDLGTSVEAGSFNSSKEQLVGICTASLEYTDSLNPEAISIDQGSILQTASTTYELSSILPKESQASLYQDRDLQICRNQSNSDSDISLTKEDDALKPDLILLKNKVNAPPFSDEWLAAVEAFGEDILQLKSGPVQNSPREKDLPEPGPWSPIKRKAQDIGPFDCTKYLKNPPTSDTQ